MKTEQLRCLLCASIAASLLTVCLSYGRLRPSVAGGVASAPRADPAGRELNGTVVWHCHQGGDPNNGGGGITKQLRLFLGAYIHARTNRMHLYKGNLSFEYTNNLASGCNAPLEALVDLDSVPHLRAMLVDEPRPPLVEAPCEPCGPWMARDAAWTGRYRAVRRGLRFAPRLRALAPRDRCPAASCACLHARLEEDFVRVFRRAGSAGAVADALRDHFDRGGFWPATTLYVAGRDDPAYRNVSRRLAVATKPDHAGLRLFEKALLDLQVCSEALYHVGTARSLFDEWISEDRLLHNRSRSWDYYDAVLPRSVRTLLPFPLVGIHGFA